MKNFLIINKQVGEINSVSETFNTQRFKKPRQFYFFETINNMSSMINTKTGACIGMNFKDGF